MSSHDLVVISLEQWDQVWRRNQYLVAELLRADPSLRVLFVEPPSDPVHDALHGRLPRWRRGVRDAPRIDGVEPGRVHLLRPTKALPRRLDPGGDRRRALGVARAARDLGLTEPTLWLNDLGGVTLLDVTTWPVLYDITDDWLAAARSPAAHDRLAAAERRVLRDADVVTVCSPTLARRKGRHRPVVLVTNGVDAERYARPAPRPDDLPAGRTAVYVGTLHGDRLDVDLCVRTARRLADDDATLVLVGPSALGATDLGLLRDAGVLVLGARPWDAVPAYLQHADALVVPHVVDAFTDSLDPIKLYEYRAAGRPVVSTPVAGFRESTDPLVLVTEPATLPDEVAAAVARPTAPRPTPRDLPTWSRQAGLLAGALEGLRSRR
ncbi:glycosyltransferase [Isoptericola sp. NEAU-Y5]|uniref:Glycosyltransferase n=1 Tax=Isoptericola luteus TaxID=2879484 RepID=A0ABS7ZCY5_9MICO|nr:glycosyltransferase [Isoptericola sp. NEAU-Y5]MCA5892901.1 glycosyltransferase [Isoptericola sp. NEAU-Y5]